MKSQVAEAAIARSEAALKQAQADESYATGNFHRVEPLLAKGFVTEDDVHKARTTADAKVAAVDQAKSQLQLAKAEFAGSFCSKAASHRRNFTEPRPGQGIGTFGSGSGAIACAARSKGLQRFDWLDTTMSNAAS